MCKDRVLVNKGNRKLELEKLKKRTRKTEYDLGDKIKKG